MTVHGVDHINISTSNLERCRDFYCGVLGLEEGWRPSFDSPGAWLYASGVPIVHVSVTDTPRDGLSAVDHIAFAVKGFEAMKVRLGEQGIAFETYDVPSTPTKQIFIEDPDGVSVELNFRDGT